MNEIAKTESFTIDGMDFVGDLTSRTTMFCSMVANTPEEQAKLFNAMNNPENRLSDFINKTIMAKDLFCEVVNLTKKEADGSDVLDADGNPVTSACPRIVIIDDKGIGYQCVSLGIYSAFKKIIAIFGEPTWKEPIPIEVQQLTRGNRKMLTINVKTGK